MMIIDAHLHTNFIGFNNHNIIDYLNNNNIDKCWLLTWEELQPAIKSLYTHLSIDDIMEVYDKYPDRIVPFYAPDPKTKDLGKVFKTYANKGIRGVGELKVNFNWDSPEMIHYLDEVNKTNFPLLFHMEIDRHQYIRSGNSRLHIIIEKIMNGGFNGIMRRHIENFVEKTGFFKNRLRKNLTYFPGYLFNFYEFEKRLQEYPKINFIAHGPHFWNNISASPVYKIGFTKGRVRKAGIIYELLKKYDNLYADISGKSGYIALSRDKKFSNFFLNEFSHKLLFGTDNHNMGHLKMLKSFKLPKNKEDLILYKNAESLTNKEL